ncbi:hypothetical protein DICVIV_01096 [Dictyocaulus viviparus]|uniref:Uncharacterized protein n=1 Tax=Dictyocaulus viviparus TaxID=29172 RepID=A0A0D8Y988_DICVI|nr:hypothetical protein DICVIV_01096 [Dictyocaulus viviparus]
MCDKEYYENDEIDGNLKALYVPALFSSRHQSARRSVRSSSLEDIRYTNIKTLFNDFCNRTSSHGVPFLGGFAFDGFSGNVFILFALSLIIHCIEYTTEFLSSANLIAYANQIPAKRRTACLIEDVKFVSWRFYVYTCCNCFEVWKE